MSNLLPSVDYEARTRRALDFIQSEYSDTVSVKDKNKPLRKWGETDQVQQNTPTTIMTTKTGIYEETYVTSNAITTVVSDSASDTQDIDFYEANPWYLMHNGTKKQLSGGSGFFVLGGKYVLTSAHVVESSSSEYIVVVSGGRKLDAKMVWSDASGSDLALLRVYDEEHNLYMHHAFLDIASHNNIHPGSVVLAFGNPFLSFPNTMSM